MKYIPYGRQSIDRDDIREVVKVLKSDWITQGPKVQEFESALAKYCGAKYAVAVSSGTAALHIACLAAGIRQLDEVITSPITFVASANCILYCGAKPVFADVQEDTINIDPQEVKKKITKETKAIIPVHFAGHPCDMKEIATIAKKHNLIVIEDAAHALGAEYKSSKIGSCKYSDMTIFSFHPVKSITTGEGGAILSNDKILYNRLLLLRNHGIKKNSRMLLNKKQGSWYYEMQELGYNYRITDFQAALGITQLKKLDHFIEKRRQIAFRYSRAFKNLDFLSLPIQNEFSRSSWHLFVLLIDFKKIKKSKEQVMKELAAKGIFTQVHYIPVHTQPYYQRKFGFEWGDFPIAEKYYRKAISIPNFPKMAEADIKYVIKNITALSQQ